MSGANILPATEQKFNALKAFASFVDDPELTGSALLVALALLRHANTEGECWPGVRTLAAKTGTSQRTVTRAIQELEAAGKLVVTRRRGASSSYRFPLVSSDIGEAVTQGKRTASLMSGEVVTPGKRNYKETTNTTTKTISDRRKRRSPNDTDPRVQPVLSTFTESYKKRFGKPPTKEVLDYARDGRRIRERIPSEYTADELAELVARFFDPALPGYVSKGFKFNDFVGAIPRLQEGVQTNARSKFSEPSADFGDWLK